VLARLAHRAGVLRWPLVAVLIAAVVTLALHRHGLWSQELAALSPVSQQSQALDASLRADVGAPDVRYLVVVSAANEQAALEDAEQAARQLQPLVEAGVIAGYESPARYLPSDATQRARLASLPAAGDLRTRLALAVDNQAISVKPDVFAPFIADVAAARARPLLRREDLQGTSMALAVDSLLTRRDGRWTAMLPLRAASGSSLQADRIRAALAQAHLPDALFVDMKAEADRLYVNYVREDIRLSLGGFAGIVVLLLIALRSPARVARTLAPLVAAVIVVVAGLALAGKQLTILHLIGMLLIVAVGSNYALFFNHREDASTFGLTVGPGAILALLFSAILAPRAAHKEGRA
jgi:predicted exporter